MDPELKEELEGPSYPRDLRDRFYRVLKELEEDLNSDPQAIFRLLREPTIIKELKARRVRIGKYRAWFIMILEDCSIVFLGFGTREKFYDRFRKRSP